MELAKRSVSVVVLEQSGHFNRSFRGESVSTDSVWMLDRLGLLDRLEGTYVQMRPMEIVGGCGVVLRADLSEFPYPRPYPVGLLQPALLSALADAGREHPGFHARPARHRRGPAVLAGRGRPGDRGARPHPRR
ncbi:FAD-dependent monooxygenase [Streptomyces lasalocidi]